MRTVHGQCLLKRAYKYACAVLRGMRLFRGNESGGSFKAPLEKKQTNKGQCGDAARHDPCAQSDGADRVSRLSFRDVRDFPRFVSYSRLSFVQ